MASKRGLSTRHALATIAALLKVRLLKHRLPLFLEWNLTFRCNLRCKYCGAHDAQGAELGTEEVLAGLDVLWGMGARWITFGGGEPLLRKDIVDIVRHAKQRGFQVYLSTNGWLVQERLDALEWVDHVNLSLDGPKDVHDAVRGNGAFDKTLEAVATCRDLDLATSLQCVLSSSNLDCIDQVIQIASRHRLRVMFQPATQLLDSSTKPNPIAPPVGPYRHAVAMLIERKKQGAPIRNSVPGLRHLAHWPDPTPIWCSAGVLTCSIEPDGTMLACHQVQVGEFLEGKGPRSPLKYQFENLSIPQHCRLCWCAPMVELGLLFSLHPGAVVNVFRSLR